MKFLYMYIFTVLLALAFASDLCIPPEDDRMVKEEVNDEFLTITNTNSPEPELPSATDVLFPGTFT